MPQIVELPGIGEVEFPDGMSEAEMSAEAEKFLSQSSKPPIVSEPDQSSIRSAVGSKYDLVRPFIPAALEPALDKVRDTELNVGLSLVKGAVALPEAMVGLVDIPTGGRYGKYLEESFGYKPKETKDILSELYSPEQKAANKEVAEARGFFRTVEAMGENPSTIVNTVAESLPSMLGGAAIGRKLLTAAPRLSPLIAGAVGEGAVSAGQTAEQLRQESDDGLLTGKQALLSATTGAGTGLIGVLGGGLAKRLGVADIDTLLAGGKASSDTAKKSILRRISESAMTEGFLEELPQSAQERIQQNIASNRPWDEGVAEASATGLLAGLAMGGAGGFVQGQPAIERTEYDINDFLRQYFSTTEPPPLPPVAVSSSEPAATEVVALPVQQASPTGNRLRTRKKTRTGEIIIESRPIPREIMNEPEPILPKAQPSQIDIAPTVAPVPAGDRPAQTPASELEVLETLEGEGALNKAQKAPAVTPVPVAAPAKTAVESQTAAATQSPEQLLRELSIVSTQLNDWVNPMPTDTDEVKLENLDAKSKLSNRANFIREALGIQAATTVQGKNEKTNKSTKAQTIPAAEAPVAKAGELPANSRVPKRGKRQAAEAAPRVLDTSGTAAFGSAFDDRIGSVDPVDKKGDAAFLKRVTDGRGEGKEKSESKRTLVLRNNETGELREVSVWDNNGAKVVDPDSKKAAGTDALKVLRKFSKVEGITLKWSPLASLRYAELQKNINRTVTPEELVALKSEYESQVVGLSEVDPAAVGAQVEGELADQPGITIVSKSALNQKAKPSAKPATTKTDADALFDAIGQPNWEGEQDGKDVILSALETSNSKQVAGYMKSLLDWIRLNNLDTATELYNFIGKVYESFERNKQAVIDGKLSPADYRAAVTSDIANASRRSVRPRAEVQTEGEESGEQAGEYVPSGDAAVDRPPAADLGAGLPEGQGMTPEAVAQAIAIEDTAGAEVQIITRDQADQITGYKETRGYAGFFWQGKVYLLPENIPNASNAREVVREEVAHALLSSPEGVRLMNSLIQSGELTITPGDRRALEQQGYLPEQITEEFIAKSARENNGWWQKVVASVRAFLSKLGLQLSNREAARALLAQLRAARTPGAPIGTVPKTAPSPSGVTQVSGKDVGVTSRAQSPALAEQIAYSQNTLTGYSLPFVRVDKADPRIKTRDGSPVIKTQFRFRPDGRNYDAEATRLADELEEVLAEGDQLEKLRISNLTTSIANSVADGEASVIGPDGRQMISDSVQQRLFNLAQTPASEAAQVLAARGHSSFDPEGELQMARNVGVNLRNIWSKSLGGQELTSVMDRLTTVFRGYLTPELVGRVLAPLNLDPRVVALVNELIARPRPDMSRIEGEIAQRLQAEFAFSKEQADSTAGSIFKTLEKTFADATEAALKSVQDGLSGTQAKVFRRGGSLWEALKKGAKAGIFDPGPVLEKMAKDMGYTVPSDTQKAKIKQDVEREEFLRTPSPRQIAAAGGNVELATRQAEKATETERLELIRRIQANWGRWSKPVAFLKWLSGNSEIARNNAQAINEFVAANLLSTATFLTRQTIDVGLVSMPLNAVNRTLAHVLERASNDGGFNAETLADLETAAKEMFKARIESLKATARQAERTARGGATRKVLERTTHSIAVFERMRVRADELEAKGNIAGARAIRLAGILKAGYRIAETWDAIQSVGTEWQEMRQQLATELRKMGKTRAAIDSQVDEIFSLTRLDVEQAKAEAAAIGAERGLTKSLKTLALDADALLKARTYDRMKEATNGRLDFQAENEVLRELYAWNLPETGGVGGLIAGTIKGIKTKTEEMGIPTGGLFSFGNAMGIAANRMATFSGGGLFGGWGFGDSPWYQGERNIRQRRIEAIQGLAAIALLAGLAAAGKILVQTKYPRDKDEKEKFIADGHKLNTIRFINDDGGWFELPISMSPFSFIASPLYMIGGVQRLLSDQMREQAKLNDEALRTGGVAGQAKPVGFGDIMGVLAQGAYGMLTGGRTAGGAIQTFSDYGDFKLNKAVAGLAIPYVPLLPAWNGVARMMGAAVDTRSATLMELLVQSPWSTHQRVNSLGDPLTNPNSGVRILQVLSGGIGFGNEADMASNRAYRQLFNAGYAVPEIQPNKGYNFNGTIRPMQGTELDRYAVARAKAFKEELSDVDTDGLPEPEARRVVQQAFNRANARALSEVGVTTATSGRGSGGTAATAQGRVTGSTGRVTGGSLGVNVPRRTSRLGLGGGSRIIATAGVARRGSRLGGTRLPRIRAPRVTRVLVPRRTRRARRNRLRR